MSSVKPNLSAQQINALISTLAKSLSLPEEQVRCAFEQGRFNSIIEAASKKSPSTAAKILSNPKELAKLAADPKIKAILTKLSKQ